MPNNIELAISHGHVFRSSFKGRLLGIMTNDDAKAIRNTPGIGRKMLTEATMPYEDLEKEDVTGLRIVVANPAKQIVFITPTIKRRSFICTAVTNKEMEYQCENGRTYAIRKLVEAKEK